MLNFIGLVFLYAGMNHICSAQFGAPDFIVLAVVLSFIGVPFAVACFLNRRFRRGNPNKMSFRWGYYFCIQVVMAIANLCWAFAEHGDIGVVSSTVCLLIYTVLAWFFAQRHHWAWVILTILTFNPIMWIINAIYLHTRWSEDAVTFSPQPQC